MVPYISETLLNEPQGRPLALVQFGVSLTFLCMFAYTASTGSAGDARWILVLVVGTALSGTAESLPKNWRQAAGVLRFAAILAFGILVAAPFVGFRFIIGG